MDNEAEERVARLEAENAALRAALDEAMARTARLAAERWYERLNELRRNDSRH